MLFGGPHDGARLPKTTRGALLFSAEVRGKSAGVRAYAQNRPGRALYRYLESRVTEGVDVYVYAGHTHVICPGWPGDDSAVTGGLLRVLRGGSHAGQGCPRRAVAWGA